MNVAVGCDHAGFEEPQPYYMPEIIKHLERKGLTVVNCGTFSSGSVDYPDFADAVCDKIIAGEADSGILLCGTGMGISMAANRHKGIRAAVCVTPQMVELARAHNDANVLCLGRRVLTLDECRNLIDTWQDTPFDGGERHRRRIAKMG